MPTRGFYIPDTLAERMEQFRHLNWSGIVQMAIEKSIQQETTKNVAGGDRLAAIARLKGENRELLESAKRLGREWAMQSATLQSLYRLTESWDSIDLGIANAYEWVARAASSDRDEFPVDFWKSVLGEDFVPNDAVALAFAEGAVNFFESIREDLEADGE